MTELQRWRGVAATLPWRDRLVLARATSRGRAVEPRLAALAVKRGEAHVDDIERKLATYGWRQQPWRIGVIATSLSLILYSVVTLLDGPRPVEWFFLAQFSFILVVQLTDRPALRRDLRQRRRSVEQNRAVLRGSRVSALRP